MAVLWKLGCLCSKNTTNDTNIFNWCYMTRDYQNAVNTLACGWRNRNMPSPPWKENCAILRFVAWGETATVDSKSFVPYSKSCIKHNTIRTFLPCKNIVSVCCDITVMVCQLLCVCQHLAARCLNTPFQLISSSTQHLWKTTTFHWYKHVRFYKHSQLLTCF